MKIRLTTIALLFFSAVCSASAAPVLYSFSFVSNTYGPPSFLSFQYLAPDYITGNTGSPYLSPGSLRNVSVDPAFSIFNVVLYETILPQHSSVIVSTTLLETYDFNQPITFDFVLTTDSSTGVSILLDLDGNYTQNLGYGRAALSVASVPEPSTAALLLFAAPVAWVYRRKRRVQG